MRHMTWLQNRMRAHALKGQTPFKMKLKRKPNLANIQEFRVAAYVKDLKARKLDLRVLVGCFVGYDIESKGYRIYWPSKQTVSVERNVVFNENDVTTSENITITSGDTSAEGEKDKIIQSIPKTSENVDDLDILEENKHQQKQDEEEQENEPQPSNTIPFPSTLKDNSEPVQEITNETQAYGRGQHSRRAPGEYRALNEGLVAATAIHKDLQSDDTSSEHLKNDEENPYLPPDFAFVGSLCLEPKTLDEVL